uniref:Pantothenate kinase n=1 Tax=Chromera velia CCMP2878 TaxID=1169474 RepID=A0A0G4HPI6_9ALVE|eukprot:Cvel_1225.t1-p1 / transcript=Cvel_1225.t1 / gene=Cvel_1225 / organism=Chromera_velia_CCMP2878 / gene_product=Pantothenate kinase 1, putative / transcript_product=Pantothenate kinase 1, putative / location=Cvel_scaffold41:13108-18570(+) / protein_length=436 / sequence_SO=supercontig / SO=protein_coding / is_pseudo=false
MSESEADKKEPPGKALCALDIGGTLAKLVCLVKEEEVSECEGDESTPREGGPLTTECNGETFRLKFRHFFTARVEELIDFLKSRELVKPGQQLPVTGGGAYKFEELFAERFKCTVAKRDEMSSVISGLDFLLGQKGVAYKYDPNKEQKVNVELSRDIYPFLVVNVGSGVSVLRVNGPKDFVRVTGTCIGGGTVLGLSHILFGAESFDEVVRLSEKGTTELDLTVRDLLGDSAGSGTLPANKTASSFGRVYMKGVSKTCEELRRSIKREDLARSLIHMVSFNLGYIAYLVARIQNVHRVFFAGKYLNNHEPTIASITRGMRFYQEHYHGLGDEDLDDSVAHVTRRGPRTPEEARGRAMGEAGGGGSSLSGRIEEGGEEDEGEGGARDGLPSLTGGRYRSMTFFEGQQQYRQEALLSCLILLSLWELRRVSLIRGTGR